MSVVDAVSGVGRFETVRLGDVAVHDERYRLTSGEPNEVLIDQIAQWGCLVPPLVQSVEGGRVPVAGFKRLRALQQRGDPEVPVIVRSVAEEAEPLEVLSLAARDERRDRELGPFEVARGIRRAFDLGADRAAVTRSLLPQLGLQAHDVVLKRHLKLERVPEPLATWLATKGVSLRRALRFVGLTGEQGAMLVRIADQARLSLRALEECSRMMSEVARRDDRTWLELAEVSGLLASAGNADGVQPAKVALKALWRLRYPSWDAQQRLAERRAREVGPPAAARFEWDDTFERDGLTLALDVRTVESLRSDLEALAAPECLARIAALLESI